MLDGVNQEFLSSGGSLPVAVDYTPTITFDAGVISSYDLIKIAYSDWGYKLDITIAIKNIQVTGTPNWSQIYFSMPPGYAVNADYEQLFSSEVWNGSAWLIEPTVKIVTTPGLEIQVVPNNNIFNNANAYVITSGSIWL